MLLATILLSLLAPQDVDQLIKQLNDEEFQVREKATKALIEKGKPALPALRKALKNESSLEVKARLNAVIREIEIEPLMHPDRATEKAPEKFKVKFVTSKGDVIIEVTRESAPLGADRFYNLVRIGYFTDIAFFRVIPGFISQFGIHGDPKVSKKWRDARLKDDKVVESNKRGSITFATSGRNSRTTQFFINTKDNSSLDTQGFSPFGSVVEGMDVIDKLYSDYGEGGARGKGPSQSKIQSEGNAYLKKEFPKLDWIKSAEIVK